MPRPETHGPALLRWLDKLTLGANVCGSVMIFCLTFLIGLDVAGRNLLGAPISGVPELVSLSIVAIVFLQVPQAFRSGRLTRSEAVLSGIAHRAPRVAAALESLFDLLGAIVVGAIVYATWPIFLRAWQRSEFVGAIGDFTAPTWPVKIMILIGGTLLVLQLLARILRRHLEEAK
ncbi:TRAP transporter small permease subunit [Tranquillimonas alkanivorans]|uniref:TRAP transporter small permease protein n=1 Tax=Tranquillimonas alkanivorans TaxID=441119 RepID=A0A1I5VX58_9RHOB|nr:TRAP transporter small permease subunit [Tranquillimonas alkanivorans]SFQ12003.1 TRAP-type mannitol/chloroaromatic compound transport system, small permease component [Tranquillimonas alkanivorans]